MDVQINATLVVEADSVQQALDRAGQASPTMSGKPMLGTRIKLSGAAPVANHVLTPNKIRQRHGLQSAGPSSRLPLSR
jgi:hypothetical protein